jgi:HAD superfamily hydrolase (TIGR01549 family)/HAD superfamily hydrolase (TIGR01509 family)
VIVSKSQSDGGRLSVKTVLFDLNDTLFDHQYCSQSGLAALQQEHASLRQKTVVELQHDHLRLLNETHAQVMQGVLSLEEARIERFRRLFAQCGENVSAATLDDVTQRYRQAYEAARRPVPGAISLLQALRSFKIKIAVVTNNFAAEQRDKLQYCGLASLVDTLIVSEEVGVEKPDPAIFEAALNSVQCGPKAAVMVGDSWQVDILGAHQASIRAVWLNRYGLVCPDPSLATEINSFEPLDRVSVLLLRDQANDRIGASQGWRGSRRDPTHIFFDVDDTLMNYRAAERAAALRFRDHFADILKFEDNAFVSLWHDLMIRHYARYLADQVDWAGQRRSRIQELFRLAHQPVPDETADRYFEIYRAYHEASWQLFPDVIPALDALKEQRLGIITNSNLAYQTNKLKRLGILDRFEWLVASEQVGVAKPDPAIFIEACRRAQAEPRDCVYVGDDFEKDAVASQAAGLRGIWVNREDAPPHPSHVIMIRDLRELAEMISRRTFQC